MPAPMLMFRPYPSSQVNPSAADFRYAHLTAADTWYPYDSNDSKKSGVVCSSCCDKES